MIVLFGAYLHFKILESIYLEKEKKSKCANLIIKCKPRRIHILMYCKIENDNELFIKKREL